MSVFANHELIAVGSGGNVDRAAFWRRVNALMTLLDAHPARRWALVCEDSAWFGAGFVALACSGRVQVIPPAPQAGSLRACNAEIDAVLTDLPERFVEFATLAVPAALQGAVAAAPDVPHNPDNGARIEFYSSGSSGALTAIPFEFGQLLAEAHELEREWGALVAGALTIATVPHYHRYGLMMRILWPLVSGRAFVDSTCLQPANIAAAAAGRDCVIASSPAFLGRVDDFASLPPAASVRTVFSAGAPLHENAARRFAVEWGRAVTEIYGSTETGGIAWRRWSAAEPRAPWRPFQRTDIDLRPEAAGDRLWVRSPATPAGDWLATGDLAVRADADRFELLGRADDVIKFEDKRISLSEMRARLMLHEWVEDARLILVPGARTMLGAAVVLAAAGRDALAASGKAAVGNALRTWLRSHYEAVLIPRKWRFVDCWPDNDMGKVTHAFLTRLFEVPA
jgi:acyl-coenzyme A synthetase/AMP-(fatty) acid ligase